MYSLIRKYPIWLFIVLMIVIKALINYYAAILFAMLAWQTLLALEIIKNWKILQKTKRGRFLPARLIQSMERKKFHNEPSYYILTLEFTLPESGKSFRMEHKSHYPPKETYRMWIDEGNPEESLLVEDRTATSLNNLFFSLLLLALFYVDYIYLQKAIAEFFSG